MIKADLHVHFNGCIPLEVVRDLAHRHNVQLPDGLSIDEVLEVPRAVVEYRDFFRPWLVLKRLPVGRACLNEMADAAVASLRRDNVVYVEFRNSPFNIAAVNHVELREAVEWLLEAVVRAGEAHHVDARL